jgi:FKBP-type peptidyl-prolyl cis-trans isomerase FkpA
MPSIRHPSVILAAFALAVAGGAAADEKPAAKDAAPATQSAVAAPAAQPAAPAPATVEGARSAATAQGVVITDLAVGHGNAAFSGAVVRVHYTGWLQDPQAADGKGKKFDSSRDRGEEFVFALGKQHVIRGWDLGVAGMQPGGKRRLVIPAELGYGAKGAGTVIPPNATLVFEVELFDFLPPR